MSHDEGRKPPKSARNAPTTTQEAPWFIDRQGLSPRPAIRATRRQVLARARAALPAARERLRRGHATWADQALVKEVGHGVRDH